MTDVTTCSAPALRYRAEVTADNRNTSHTQVAELISMLGAGHLRILEVGCASGYLSAYLKTFGHWVCGVEPSPTAAAAARAVLDEVHTGDFDSYLAATAGTTQRPFDVIVFADVLEHLVEPAHTLRECRSLLAPEGHVAISVPNVTHGGIRGMLLEGRWTYAELGILDRTHLRFFSRAGFIDLLDEAAFSLVELRRTTMPLQTMDAQFGISLSKGTIELVQSAARDCDAETFQFVALTRPDTTPQHAAAANARWRSGPIASADVATTPAGPWRRTQAWVRTRGRAIARLLRPG